MPTQRHDLLNRDGQIRVNELRRVERSLDKFGQILPSGGPFLDTSFGQVSQIDASGANSSAAVTPFFQADTFTVTGGIVSGSQWPTSATLLDSIAVAAGNYSLSGSVWPDQLLTWATNVVGDIGLSIWWQPPNVAIGSEHLIAHQVQTLLYPGDWPINSAFGYDGLAKSGLSVAGHYAATAAGTFQLHLFNRLRLIQADGSIYPFPSTLNFLHGRFGVSQVI